MLERLQKFLARAGIASRRKAEDLIADGRVSVNGTVIREMGVKVDPEADEIRVNTEIVRAPLDTITMPDAVGGVPGSIPEISRAAVYLAMHKPAGVLCTANDPDGRPTVYDLLPRLPRRVFPIGRLDEDSEGLLLLTSDGTLSHLLTHPRYEVEKTYDLRVRGEVGGDEVREVARGIWLSEGRTAPGRMRIKRRGRNISHIVVTLREGKNRELRRIFARLRHPVLSLRRVSVGPIALGSLKRGMVRRLGIGEVRGLYAAALNQGAAPAAKSARRRAGAKPARGRTGSGSDARGAARPASGPARQGKPAKDAGKSPKARRPARDGDHTSRDTAPKSPGRRPAKGSGKSPGTRRPARDGDYASRDAAPQSSGRRPAKGSGKSPGTRRPARDGDYASRDTSPQSSGRRPAKGAGKSPGTRRPARDGDYASRDASPQSSGRRPAKGAGKGAAARGPAREGAKPAKASPSKKSGRGPAKGVGKGTRGASRVKPAGSGKKGPAKKRGPAKPKRGSTGKGKGKGGAKGKGGRR